jgi:L-seryl-tRNA(Ser) seleniumtransferase
VRRLTGSEAALVVNNNAAAVSLVVNELALRREVIVSRGELVEIGGSFRIPEIIARSGGELVEVGTTNRTRIEDYRRSIGANTGLILKVHPSNYRIRGFVEDVPLAELTELGRREGVPVANDLGSGLLLSDLLTFLPVEPDPREAAAAGADVVTWSGDKLLGGPQAGVIHGSAELVDRLRANPLLRAFRVDKLTLAALEATLRLYANPTAAAERIPAVAMLRESPESVRARAESGLALCSAAVQEALDIRPMRAVVGGGAYPEVTLESAGWCVAYARPDALERRCRAATPPLIGRIEDDAFCVDFRTIRPGEERDVARVVSDALEAP